MVPSHQHLSNIDLQPPPPAPPGAFPTLCSEGAGAGMGLGYTKAGAPQGSFLPASVYALPGQASLHEVAHSWASSPSP